MLAVKYRKHGSPTEVVELVPLERAPLQPTDVRCELLASPINPSDLLSISGHYANAPSLPAIAGIEGVGRIIELGDEITDLRVGQNVMLPVGCGSWRTQIVARAGDLLPVPDDGDPKQLSMLAINPPTAWLLLHGPVELRDGDWLVQNAANSSVGGYIIQLAKTLGIRTANVVRRPGLEAKLQAWGADVVLVDGPGLSERIRSATGDAGVRLAIDGVGGEATRRLANALADGGVVVNYGTLSMKPCQVGSKALIFQGVQLRGFWLDNWFRAAPPNERKALYEKLAHMLRAGNLHTEIAAMYPLERVGEAIAHAMSDRRPGKILLGPGPS